MLIHHLTARAYDLRLDEAPVVAAPTAEKSEIKKRQEDPEARRLGRYGLGLGVEQAEMGAPEPAVTDNASMEALIPEKNAQREPQQIGLPGMAKPKGTAPQAFSAEETATQAEKPFATVLTRSEERRVGKECRR